MPHPDAILFFVKAPRPGTVKTRLAASLGHEAAARLYRAFGRDMLRVFALVPGELTVCCEPPDAAGEIRDWLGPEAGEAAFLPQRGRDLGERMRHAFGEAFAAGARQAVLVGSDLPDLPPAFLRNAFLGLSRHHAVIAPSLDGGYYLIGFTAAGFCPEAFADIPWSTERVFERSLRALRRLGRSVLVLPRWRDVDVPDDLAALRSRLSRAPEGPASAPETRAVLRELDPEPAAPLEDHA